MENDDNIDQQTLPKKILKISDLVFILPDDFDGSLQNALMLLAAYLNIKFNNTDAYAKGNVPLQEVKRDGDTYKVSMEYGIFRINEDGEYELLP